MATNVPPKTVDILKNKEFRKVFKFSGALKWQNLVAVRTAAAFLWRAWIHPRCCRWEWSCSWSVQCGSFQTTSDWRKTNKDRVLDGGEQGSVLFRFVIICIFVLPGRRSHHAAPGISHPAIVGEATALGTRSTVPLLSQSLLPAVTLHHNLAAGAKRLRTQ